MKNDLENKMVGGLGQISKPEPRQCDVETAERKAKPETKKVAKPKEEEQP